MKAHSPLLSLALTLLLLVSAVAASSRASFCKCSCKRNSTIIALTGSYKSTSGSLSSSKSSHSTHNSTNDASTNSNTSDTSIGADSDMSPSDIAAAAAAMHDPEPPANEHAARDTTSKASNTPSEGDSTSETSDSDVIGGGPDKVGETVDLGGDHARTCNDCNRQFCLWHDLPILEDCRRENKGNEEDIFAECFQRDSAKDQAVVYTFIVLTSGLLVYAAVKPWLERRGGFSGKGGVGLGLGGPGGVPGSRSASYVPVRQDIGIVGPAGSGVDDFAVGGVGGGMERATSATRERYD